MSDFTYRESVKGIVIGSYVAFVGSLLWLMTFAEMKTFDFASYVRYLFLFFGGSFAFLYLTELMKIDVNIANYQQWLRVQKQLFVPILGILIAVGFTYLMVWVGNKYEDQIALIATSTLLVLIIFGIWLTRSAIKFHNELSKLSSVS